MGPRRSKEEETQAASGVAPRLAMMKAEVKPHVKKEHKASSAARTRPDLEARD